MFNRKRVITFLLGSFLIILSLYLNSIMYKDSDTVYENHLLKSNIVVQIIALEKSSTKVSTDHQIQNLENRYKLFLERYSFKDVKNEIKHLCHSIDDDSIQQHCDNIIKVINNGTDSIDWGNYGQDNEGYYVRWKHVINNGIAHGYDQKITGENRLKLIATSIILKSLIQTHYESLKDN